MKIRHAMILLLTVAMPAYATEQWPDFLILNGVLYELPVSSYPSGDLPLESLWKNPRAELRFSVMSTGCWRGYTAVWEIKDDSLYLRALDAWRDHKKVGLKDIFPERFKDGRVKADWFDGQLAAAVSDHMHVYLGGCTLSFAKGELARVPNEVKERGPDRGPRRQVPDMFIFDGTVYYLPAEFCERVFPMESLWKDCKARPRLSRQPDGRPRGDCARGYTALWEASEDCLYLLALNAWTYGMKADLKAIFPERFKNGRVKADWFSGDLSLTADELSWLFTIFREENTPPEFYEITLQIKDGNLRSVKRHDPPDPKQHHGPGPLVEQPLIHGRQTPTNTRTQNGVDS
jgi:hypothetical protein